MAVPQQSILALAAILTSAPGGEGGGSSSFAWGVRGGPQRSHVGCLLAAWELPDSKSAVFFRLALPVEVRYGGNHQTVYTSCLRAVLHERVMDVILKDFHPWITSLHYASSTTGCCEKSAGLYTPQLDDIRVQRFRVRAMAATAFCPDVARGVVACRMLCCNLVVSQ